MRLKARRQKDSRPILEALEDQILYSADALGGIDATPLADREDTALEASLLPMPNPSNGATALTTDTAQARAERHEVVFVDSNTEHYQQLLDGLIDSGDEARQFDVYLLDGQGNGISQISDVLAGYKDVDAVHIISHGQDGSIRLGNAQLNSDTLTDNASQVQGWAEAFTQNGDLLLYGCNLADGANGVAFISELSRLTGADIAASDDLTGHSSLNGDWALEHEVGTIETEIAIHSDAQAQWVDVLADTTSGLVAHWTFDTNANDVSGNANHGTLAGDALIDPTNATDRIGDAKLSLDGGGDYVNLDAHIPSLSSMSQGTITAWIRTTDSGENTIFGASDSGEVTELAKFSVEGGQLKWLNINDSGADVIAYSDALINDGAWHHVALSVGAGGNTLYIDGAAASVTYMAGAQTDSSFLDDITDIDAMDIGRSVRSGGPEAEFNGLLDDVKMYNRVLTAADITALASESPFTSDDSTSTPADTAVGIDVLANDTVSLEVLDVSNPANGSAVINEDGTVSYTPNPGFSGADSFTYLAADSTRIDHFWGLDGDAVDAIGSSNGTVVSATPVAGTYGNALSFDGVDDHVLIPDLAINSDFTVSFSFKLDDNSGTLFQYLYSHGDINDTNSLNIFINEASHGTDPNVLRTVVRDTDDSLSNTALEFDISSIVGDGNWHTYTLTVEGGVGSKVYLDGVLQNSDVSLGGDSFNPAGDLYLGARQDLDADRRFNGAMESVAIYNQALEPAQIQAGQPAGTLAATVNVDVASGVTYPDSNGQNNSFEWITNVSLSDINSSSGMDAGGYGDYTGQSTSLTIGESATLSVTINADSQNYVSAWVDWNHDGDFTDPGEAYVLATNTSSNGPHTVNITPPPDAVVGDTMMRVAVKYQGAPGSDEIISFGEVEDYTITVQAPIQLVATQTTPGPQSLAEDTALTFSVANGNAVTVSDSVVGTDTRLQVFLSVNDGVLNLSQMTGISILSGSNDSAFMTIQGTESDLNAAFEGMTFTPNADFFGSVTLNMTTSLGVEMAGHYTFDGGTAIDQSVGTTQNGTLAGNAVTTIDLQRGEVLSLDGSGDYVEVPGMFGNPANLTVAAWVNLTSADTSGANVISLGDNFALRLDQDGAIKGYFTTASSYHFTEYSTTLAGTGWHHVAFSFDDINNVQVLYLDGVAVATSNEIESITYNSGVDSFIGKHGNGSANYDFNGLIDDARIYTRALSAEEIVALHAGNAASSDSVAITVNAENPAPTNLSSGIELNTDGGNDSFLTLTDARPVLGGLTETTVEIAFQLDSTPVGYVPLLDYREGGIATEFGLGINADGSLRFVIGDGASQSTTATFSQLFDGQSHRISVSWENTQGQVSVYVDGEYVESMTAQGIGHVTANGAVMELLIGQDADDARDFYTDNVFQGTLYDVRIWDEVRSEDEIALNHQYKFDSGSLPGGLVANWQMDGFNGSNEVVDVVSGNNLSVGNVLGNADTSITLWTDQTGGASASGNTVTFVDDGQSGWDSEVNSATFSSLGYNDDYTVSFRLDSLTNFGFVIGLGAAETPANFSDVDYSMYFDHNLSGSVAVYANSAGAGNYSLNYAAGDEFSFYVNGTTIEYQHNGVTFHTATGVPPATDWYVDSAFYAASGSYANQEDYSLSNFRIFSGNTETGTETGFTASTPIVDLHVVENSANGTSVGFVIPTAPDVFNDVVSDGLFMKAGKPPASPGYETYYANGSGAGSALGDWTVTANDVDTFNGTWMNPPGGGIVVDMNGGAPGTIEQTIATEAGKQYQIVFAMSGDFDVTALPANLRVSADGQSQDFSMAEPDNFAWGSKGSFNQYSMTFTADDTAATLAFQSLDTGNSGPYISNIRVTEIHPAISTILGNDPTLSYDAATEKFYRAVSTPLLWGDALAAANGATLNGVTGQLPTINSNYENDLIHAMAVSAGDDVWLGASDLTTEGEFLWYEGSQESEQFWTGGQGGSVVAGHYTNFTGSGPDNSGDDQHSVALSQADGRWDDRGSDVTNAYVIEWDASEVLSNFTFTLTDDAGGRFAIDANTGEVTVADGTLLDYETATSHSVTIDVTDAAGNSYSEVMSIAVNNRVSELTQTIPDSQTVEANTVLTFNTANSNTVSVSDTDAATNARLQVFLAVNDGILTLSQTTGLSIMGGSNGSSFMTLQGTEADLNAAFEGMTFTPDSDFSGAVTLQMTTSLGADLVGHYTFDAGNAVDDSVGISQNGTLTGDATIVTDGTRGEVLNLDGAGDHVLIDGMFGNPDTLTLSAWVNYTGESGNDDVISLGGNVTLRADETTGSAGIKGSYRDASGVWHDTNSGAFISGTGWHHIAYTIDDVANTQTIFIDGVAVSTTTHTNAVAYTIGGTDTAIGINANTFTSTFKGLIDEARIYTRALSADEVAALAADEASTSDTVSITVRSAPANLTITAPASASTNEDTTFVYSGANVISVDDGLVADSPMQVTLSVANGYLTLANQIGITVVDGDDGSSLLTIEGLESDINTALDGLQYTPYNDFSGSDTLNISTSIAANLEGLYSFAGGVAADHSAGTSNDGILIGDASIVDIGGTRGEVLSLDGSGDAVQIAGTFGNPTSVTIGGWVNLTGTGRNEFISLGDRVHIALDDSVTGVKGSIQSGAGSWNDLSSGQFISGTGWHHVTYTFDDAADMHRLYIDGVEVASESITDSIYWSGATTTYIGQHPLDSAWNLAGQIDDARIYDRALSAEEIASIAADNPGAVHSVAITVDPINDAPTFFVGDGIAETPIATLGAGFVDMVVQPDGKLLGLSAPNTAESGQDIDFALIRYNADGTPDTSFGTDGVVITAVTANNESARSLVLQPDGKILVAGSYSPTATPDSIVMRYDANGVLDTTFDGDGMMMFDVSTTSTDVINEMALQDDGKIVVTGYGNFSGDEQMFAARINTDGTLDTSFDGDGIRLFTLTANDDRGNAIAIQPDGQIVIAGQSHNGTNNDLVVIRLNEDGSNDTSFDTDGVFTYDSGATDVGTALAIDTSGRIVVAGTSSLTGSGDSIVLRLNPDGALDGTFATAGLATVAAGSPFEAVNAIGIQSDGKIVVVGDAYNGSNNDLSIFRLDDNGTLDTSFDDDGLVRNNLNGATDSGKALAIAADGTIFVAGNTSLGVGTPFVAKYDSDGSLVSQFALVNTLDGNPTFVSGSSAVILDADVGVFDAELSKADDFSGASLTIERNAGADATDVFSATGLLAALTETGPLIYNGTTIGTVTTNSAGTLVLTFNSNATNALVNGTMRAIAYENSSGTPPGSVQLDWTFDDGNASAQGSGGAQQATGFTTVNIMQVAAPGQLVPNAQNVNEDEVLTFSVANGNAVTVSDGLVGTDARLQVFISVNDGRLQLSQTTGLSIMGGSNGGSFMTIHGTESDLNAAFEGMTFTPNADFNGAVTLNMTTSLGADLVGHYEFEGNANDTSVGLTQQGTFNGNATTITDGTRGEVLSLDGAGDYVAIGDEFNQPTDLTLAAWINFSTSASTAGEVISISNAVALRVGDATHGVTGFFYDGATFEFIGTGTSSTLQDDAWHHVAFSFDDVNNTQNLYIDGVLVASASHTASIDYPTWYPGTSIGSHADPTDSNFDFKGLIDDSRIYTRALSAEEIAALAADQTETSNSVAITVGAVNDAPTITDLSSDFRLAVNDGVPVTLKAGGLATVADVDSVNFDGGSIQFTGNGFDGLDQLGFDTSASLSLSAGMSNGSVVSVSGVAIGTLSGVTSDAFMVSLNGDSTPSRVASLLNQTTFESTSTVFGSRSVDVALVDGDGVASGGTDTTTVSMSVNLASSVNGSITATEDTPYTYGTSDFDFTGVVGTDLRDITVTTLPGVGQLLLNGTPVTVGQTLSYAEIDAGQLTYEPAPNGNGSAYASFEFFVNAGNQSLTVLTGAPSSYTLNSTYLTPTDDILENDSNFGPSGTHSTHLQFGATTTTIDAAYLSGGEILFGGYVSDGNLDAGELAAIDGWVSTGGVLISTSDSASYDSIPEHFGLVIGGSASSTWEVAATGHAIIDGPFGSVGNVGDPIMASGTISYFDSASLQPGDVVIANDSVSGEPTIVARQHGNGWILFASDEGMFRAGMSNDGSVATPNDILAANIFAWAADAVPKTSHQMDIDVSAVNDAPTVTINSVDVEFTEQSPVGIDINISINDIDDTNLEGATVRITAGYESGVDSLNWTPQAGITGTFDAPTGTLTFTGTATVADYQALLRTVSFVNNSDSPDTTTRTVEVFVDDGTDTSTAVTRNININVVNDEPTTPNVSASGAEDTTLSITLSGSDVDGTVDSFEISSLPANGTLYLDAALTDPIIAFNTYAASSEQLTVYFSPDANWTGTTTFSFSATDNQGNWDKTPATATLSITPANDPAVIGGADTGAVAEDVAVSGGNLLTSGALTISDPDAGEAVFTAATLNNIGELILQTDGKWSYSVANSLPAVQQLDSGETLLDSFTISSVDGTTHTINITINGAEDAAVIGGTATGTVAEDGTLTANGTLTISDVDSGDNPVSFNDQASTLGVNGYGNFELTSGTWTYTLNNAHASVQALDVGESLTDSYTFTASDGSTQTVTITINGAEDAPVIGGTATGTVAEDGTLTASDTLTISDVDTNDNPVNFNDQASTLGANGYGNFELTSGTWTYTLNNAHASVQALDVGESLTDSYTFTATDGSTQTVTITINGAEDAALIGGTATGTVAEDSTLTANGTLTISDVDSSDNPVSFNDQTSTLGTNGYGNFELTAGNWTYSLNNAHASVQALDVGESLTDSYTFTASDGSTQTVTITINGAEDAPVIGGTATGTVAEDGTLTANGTLTISDVDSNDNPVSFNDQASTLSANGYGNFELSAGSWTYTLNNAHASVQALDVSESLTDSYTFSASDGSTQTVTITINGAEDAAVIGGTATGTVAEDGTLTASDTLTITDVDTSDNPVSFNDQASTLGTNGYGNFELTSGTWTYTLNNAHALVQALDVGESLTDSYTFTASDGSTQTVTITINGAEDAAVIGGTATGTVAEDGTLTANGTLTISDSDSSDNPVSFNDQASTLGVNGYGNFELTSGTWTYTLNNAHSAVQALDVSESLTDSYTFTASDGSTQTVTITINGAEDAAVIGGTATGTVAEDGTLTASDTLTITDVDTSDNPVSFNDQASTLGTNGYGNFELTSGTWTYTLNNAHASVQALDVGESLTDSYTFTATDGSTQTITVTINGAEDAAVIGGTATGTVAEDGTLTASDTLTISDVDSSDNPIAFNNQASTLGTNGYGNFELTSGTWTYTLNNAHSAVQALDVGETLTDSYTFTASDGSTQTVTITINGAEDAAVIGGTATGTVAEDGTLTANGTLTISDVDSSDNPVSFNDQTSTLGTNGYGNFELTSGTWTYTLNNAHSAVQALDVGETLTDSYTFTASDGSTQTVTITINGAEDAAVIGGTATGTVAEDGTLTANGTLTISDVDSNDNPVSFNDQTSTLGVNGYGNFELTAGSWTYTLNNAHASVQALDVSESLTDSYTFSASDGSTQTVTITINGAEDAAVIGGTATGTVAEDGTLTASDTLTITDVDTSDNPVSFNDQASTLGTNGYGNFELTSGTWTYTLNNAHSAVQALDVSESLTDSYTFTASDGSTQTVTITINGAEDAAVIGGTATGTVAEDGTLTASDTLTITDVDTSDNPVSFNDQASTLGTNGYGNFELTSGTWTYTLNNAHASVQALDVGESLTDSYTFPATDGSTQTITITINGAEDAAVIGGTATGTVAEDSTLTANGTLTISDVDSSDNPVSFNDQASTLGVNGYGNFELTSGTWTYTLNNAHASVQALDVGESLTDSYTFTASDGSTQTVTITINGAEDAPVIGGTATGTVAEDGTLTANGTLTISDVDSSDNPVSFNDQASTLGTNGYGNFELTSGTWTYTLNNAHSAVQALDVGETLTDSYTFTASDGSTQTVTITINGAEDAAVIGGTATGTVAEDGTLTASDTLTITDVDSNDNPVSFNDQASTLGTNGYGNFELTSGTWTYTLNNAHSAVQALDVGETLTDSYTFSASDGSTQTVTITINGAEDAAVIGGTATGTVAEDGTLTASDTLTITDVDTSDNPVSFNDQASTLGTNGYGNFELTSGTWTYTLNNAHALVQALDVGESLTDSYTFTASDGSTQTVTITINGAEDAPVIGGTATGTVAEDGTLTASDTLTISDVDTNDNPVSFNDQASTLGTNGYGNFELTSGTWTYTLNNAHASVQALDAGESLTDSYTFTASDGSTQTVTITINGAEDAAVIGGTATGTVAEDGTLTANGTLTISDVDSNDNPISFNDQASTPGVNGYGNFELLSGTWTYTLNNAHASVQALDVGEALTDSYTFMASDGSTQTVTVTINGAEDAAVIGGTATGTITVSSTLSASGTLTISDADTSDNPVSLNDQASTLGVNGYGNFELTSGTWTYTLDSTHAAVASLNSADTLSDSFTFTANDGSTQVVTIAIDPGLPAAPPPPTSGPESPGNPGETGDPSPEPVDPGLNDVIKVATGLTPQPDSPDQTTPDPALSLEVPESEEDLNPAVARDVQNVEAKVSDRREESTSEARDRRLNSANPDPIDDFTALDLLITQRQELVDKPSDDGSISESTTTDNLRRATQQMRDQMDEAAKDERFAERAADIALRASGTTLSVGSLAWLLRAGSLFASALSAVPTWAGFDPLPVLAKKKRAKKRPEAQEKSTKNEREEDAAGRVLDSISTPQVNDTDTPGDEDRT